MDLESLDIHRLNEFLLNLKESDTVELKSSTDFPNAFWETYSSFANTKGGLIVLGVKEGSPHNEIIGVRNYANALNTLWNNLSNSEKVSYRTVNNQDVQSAVIDDKTIILIKVNEAPNSMKPVYINGKIDNTYIRTGDGDRKAKTEEIAALLRNAKPGLDSLPAVNFTLSDLDERSILSFKQEVSIRFPKKRYLQMDNAEFLTEIGACRLDRKTGKIEVLKGTVLFLGKVNSIRELYPHYHVDYFNHRGHNPRWSDRVTDDEPNDYEMNIYNFYTIVSRKLNSLLMESFSMDGNQRRLPLSGFDDTIRECFVNCLAHADYDEGYPSIKIEAYDGWFKFFNPGEMLISQQQFRLGGDSRLRNEVIMSMFRLIGASERQGMGGPQIYKTALVNDFRQPEVDTNLEHTELRVWNIDLTDSYPDLSENEKAVLSCIAKSRTEISISQIKKKIPDLSNYYVRKALQTLERKELVMEVGAGRSTKYVLRSGSDEFYTKMQIELDAIRSGT